MEPAVTTPIKITDEALMSGTSSKYGTFAKQLKSLVARYYTSGRPKEILIDEFNIDWANTAVGRQRREGTINVAWTASVLNHLLYAGVDVANIFSLTECGIIDQSSQPFPIYHLFPFLSAHLKGNLHPGFSSNPLVESHSQFPWRQPLHLVDKQIPKPQLSHCGRQGPGSRQDGQGMANFQWHTYKEDKSESFGVGTKPLVLPGYSVTALLY